MNFYEKHPYIMWQFIGWGCVAVAFLFMILTLDMNYDFIIPTFVFIIIGGALVIFISPPVIYYTRKDKWKNYNNKLIKLWYEETYGYKAEFAISIISVLIFMVLVAFMLRSGLFFLIPLAVYAGAIPYIILRNIMKKRFIQVLDAEQYCDVIDVKDAALLDSFNNNPTLMYRVNADKDFFHFLYNYYQRLNILKHKQIKFYRVDYSLLNSKYGFKFTNQNSTYVLCITGDDIVIDKRAFGCYTEFAYLYSSFVSTYQRVLKNEVMEIT